MADDRFLITGGTGCIGSWVVRGLVREGAPVTVVSTGRRRDRLELILTPAELAAVDIVVADATDLEAIEAAARRSGVTAIVHLAALQLPLCAADPVTGARVNVQGTATAFELARRLEIGRVVYASSAAVYGPRDRYAYGGGGPGRRALPDLALRRVQGRERAGGAGLLGDGRHREHRSAAPLRVRPRAATRASRPSPPWR